MSLNTVVISNSREGKIRDAFGNYFQNFFVDNKNVVESFSFLSPENTSNIFDTICSKILLSSMSNNGIFVNSDGTDTTEFVRYNNIFYCIYETSCVLYEIMSKSSNYIDIYGVLRKIVIHGKNETVSSDILAVAQTVSYTLGSNLTTQYILNGSTLDIYCKQGQFTGSFTKPADMKIVTNTSNNSDDNKIIEKYVTFLMCFNKYNSKMQVFAFFYFMIILDEYRKFRYEVEKMYHIGSNGNSCDFFQNFSANLMQLNETFQNTIMQSGNSESNTSISFSVKCIDLCPIVLDMEENEMIIDMFSQLNDNYVIIIGGETYDILTASYVENAEKTGKRVQTITVKATSSQAKSCNISNPMPVLDIPKNRLISVMVRQKNIIDLRKEYISTGQDLREMNISIDKSKNKINSLSSASQKQKEHIRTISTRMYIYIAIIAIFMMMYIVGSTVKNGRKFRLNIGIISFLVLAIMNTFNYIVPTYSIESFVNSPGTKNCNELGSGSAISDRVKFIQDNIGILTTYTLDILLSYHLQLSTLDSEDLFKSISNSMQNERSTYSQHKNVYNTRVKSNKAYIDLEKHELNEKSQFVYFMSLTFLIISMLYIMYAFDDQYAILYLIAAAILLFIVLYQYYYAILHPVRSRSRNKYWRKPKYVE